MTVTPIAQVSTTLKWFSSASSQPIYLATAEDASAARSLSSSASPVEPLVEGPQAALTDITTSNSLITATLVFIVLSNVILFLIFFQKLGKKYLGSLIGLKLRKFAQETNLLMTIRTILDKIEKQQGLLQSMENKQQSLLSKVENMERSIGKTDSLQAIDTARSPMAVDNPQTTPVLSPADHLVHVLEQGGDRAAMARWPVTKVKITAASRDLIYQGLDSNTGVELEPTQSGASFLIFQVNGENLLVPNQKTIRLFQLSQRGHAGLFTLERQPSQPAPQVNKPARVQLQGKFWQVVEQGRIFI